jgi:hypothetical protein
MISEMLVSLTSFSIGRAQDFVSLASGEVERRRRWAPLRQSSAGSRDDHVVSLTWLQAVEPVVDVSNRPGMHREDESSPALLKPDIGDCGVRVPVVTAPYLSLSAGIPQFVIRRPRCVPV